VTWVRLDDHFADHPKILGLSDGAYRAFVDGLCYASRYLTDGHIPTAAVKTIARHKLRPVAELIEAGLWEQNGSGVIVHDYLEFQPSRSTVKQTVKQELQQDARAGLGQAKQNVKRKGTIREPRTQYPNPNPVVQVQAKVRPVLFVARRRITDPA
jgi:hypothetical protein